MDLWKLCRKAVVKDLRENSQLGKDLGRRRSSEVHLTGGGHTSKTVDRQASNRACQAGVPSWSKTAMDLEIHVSVVGREGVGKTTFMLQMENEERRFKRSSDFHRDYFLNAICAPGEGKPEERVKFVFKEVGMRRLKTQPLQALFKDEIVILVYSTLKDESLKQTLHLALGIKTVFPDAIFFILGSKASDDQLKVSYDIRNTPEGDKLGDSLEDSVRLHIITSSFRSPKFLEVFLDSFMKIAYHKSCRDRGVPVLQPETVTVRGENPHFFPRYSSTCSIL